MAARLSSTGRGSVGYCDQGGGQVLHAAIGAAKQLAAVQEERGLAVHHTRAVDGLYGYICKLR